MAIEDPLAHYTYVLGELTQACEECDWAQTGHSRELVHCPACDAPLGDRAAIAFGGTLVIFDGGRFHFHSVLDGCGWVPVDEADYPDVIAFMCRHGTDVLRRDNFGTPRVRRIDNRRDFRELCRSTWRPELAER